MWFKNIIIFKFLTPFAFDEEALQQALNDKRFRPCNDLELKTMGWVTPLGRDSELLYHAANNCFFITAKTQERVLPATVVREAVEERIEEIEIKENRTVRQTEKATIRDEVLQRLIPRAFKRSQKLSAYIDVEKGWLLVDTASRKKAEDFATLLRTSLGSLPVVPPKVCQSPSVIMTDWLKTQQLPTAFMLADSCELTEALESGAMVNCKRQDLFADEISAHLDAGKMVSRLALTWLDRVSCVISEDLIIRRFQFMECVQELAQEVDTDDRNEQFDVDFSILSGELREFLPQVFEVFGGEDMDAYETVGK